MSSQSFIQKLTAASQRNNSLLCVGLDPDPYKYPTHFPATIDTAALVQWGTRLIDQTAHLVCCYKPNFAFYEQHGPSGLEALRQTIAAVPNEIPVLLDAKRGDIGSTATAYARAAFEIWGADAVTVNPYLGQDSIAPFVAYPGKTAFVLCYTSNASAAEIQEFGSAERLFERIIRRAKTWGEPEQIAFVVGATQPHALARVREVIGSQNHWILAPGIGAQGGDLSTALAAGLDRQGSGLIVPVSRGVIYADDPGASALKLRDEIDQVRQAVVSGGKPQPRSNQDLILALHEAGCVQFGQFTLASGQTSPIYVDLRRITASSALLELAAQAYAALVRPLNYNHLAAVPYAAMTLGTATALATNSALIYPRKEVKAHGTGKSIEGVFEPGDQVVVIEDLVTSGGSVLKAIEQLEGAGLKVSDVVVLIDREQGGPDNLAKAGYHLHAALTLSDILETLHQTQRISLEQKEAVQRYLQAN